MYLDSLLGFDSLSVRKVVGSLYAVSDQEELGSEVSHLPRVHLDY